ncbi:hypothetical protein [Kineococcus rhizosphaerae]|uniref:hypothetical protein n=1 Tax=Kineococcus rhizosphaerae TaxID=559628 RepID=UPI000D0693BB|nr:hypothetical protein [Kineococcus rhizosphaerae]
MEHLGAPTWTAGPPLPVVPGDVEIAPANGPSPWTWVGARVRARVRGGALVVSGPRGQLDRVELGGGRTTQAWLVDARDLPAAVRRDLGVDWAAVLLAGPDGVHRVVDLDVWGRLREREVQGDSRAEGVDTFYTDQDGAVGLADPFDVDLRTPQEAAAPWASALAAAGLRLRPLELAPGDVSLAAAGHPSIAGVARLRTPQARDTASRAVAITTLLVVCLLPVPVIAAQELLDGRWDRRTADLALAVPGALWALAVLIAALWSTGRALADVRAERAGDRPRDLLWRPVKQPSRAVTGAFAARARVDAVRDEHGEALVVVGAGAARWLPRSGAHAVRRARLLDTGDGHPHLLLESEQGLAWAALPTADWCAGGPDGAARLAAALGLAFCVAPPPGPPARPSRRRPRTATSADVPWSGRHEESGWARPATFRGDVAPTARRGRSGSLRALPWVLLGLGLLWPLPLLAGAVDVASARGVALLGALVLSVAPAVAACVLVRDRRGRERSPHPTGAHPEGRGRSPVTQTTTVR